MQEAGAPAGWTSFIDAVEEELVDAFLIAFEEVDASRDRSQGRNWFGRPAKAPGTTSFRVAVMKCSLGAERHGICMHILTARQRLDELLLGEEHIDHTRCCTSCWCSPDRHTNWLLYL